MAMFACSQCGARFQNLQALGGHKSSHSPKRRAHRHAHGHWPDKRQRHSNSPPPTFPFHSPLCSLPAPSMSNPTSAAPTSHLGIPVLPPDVTSTPQLPQSLSSLRGPFLPLHVTASQQSPTPPPRRSSPRLETLLREIPCSRLASLLSRESFPIAPSGSSLPAPFEAPAQVSRVRQASGLGQGSSQPPESQSQSEVLRRPWDGGAESSSSGAAPITAVPQAAYSSLHSGLSHSAQHHPTLPYSALQHSILPHSTLPQPSLASAQLVESPALARAFLDGAAVRLLERGLTSSGSQEHHHGTDAGATLSHPQDNRAMSPLCISTQACSSPAEQHSHQSKHWATRTLLSREPLKVASPEGHREPLPGFQCHKDRPCDPVPPTPTGDAPTSLRWLSSGLGLKGVRASPEEQMPGLRHTNERPRDPALGGRAPVPEAPTSPHLLGALESEASPAPRWGPRRRHKEGALPTPLNTFLSPLGKGNTSPHMPCLAALRVDGGALPSESTKGTQEDIARDTSGAESKLGGLGRTRDLMESSTQKQQGAEEVEGPFLSLWCAPGSLTSSASDVVSDAQVGTGIDLTLRLGPQLM